MPNLKRLNQNLEKSETVLIARFLKPEQWIWKQNKKQNNPFLNEAEDYELVWHFTSWSAAQTTLRNCLRISAVNSGPRCQFVS